MIGALSWANGVSSRADLKQIGYDRWMEQYEDQEKVKKKRSKQMSEGQKLWEQMNKKK